MTNEEIDAVAALADDIENAEQAWEALPAVVAALREAREEAQALAEAAFGENWALWETACRLTPWLKNPFHVEQKVEELA